VTNLALRSIGRSDYAVIDDGHPVGCIRYAAERTNEIWIWNVTIPESGAVPGTSPSVEEAKAVFKESGSRSRSERLASYLATDVTLMDAWDQRQPFGLPRR
jgi:hypothetical protein